ncbi:MAG: bifunctional diaminohydroxyphosphoribosylaminopyrimidine deaminase/5-amino-6-(5-phosphoribosylamino)uracil reductase RibD [Thermoanaerobaculia bacterium]|nr:bifunctional diaminohydroxyphosphoribosylaminopyrimidine deaminase/5-amino-6-(5-phosphoribosylamino)uracil reductase RibD [Thermoanaerobaculia bacterium]
MTDMQFMSRALELAANGRYSASPNPMVGCVVVREGRVIGEGFHLRAGLPHAEIEALRNCPEDPAGATLYVNLEPCSHHGRTPPCVDALIEARIGKVVVALGDPHPEVNGAGIRRLREAGIHVETGLLAEEARHLNEKFLVSVATDRPFVLLKAAMTLDGKLATETRSSRWITSEAARHRSLELREEYDAILVGAGTIAADDPELTRRLGLSSSITPWTRVVVDATGRVPAEARVLRDGEKTILVTSSPSRIAPSPGLEIVSAVPDGWDEALTGCWTELGARGIRSIIVEGGSGIHTTLIRHHLWHKMALFIAPKLIGGSAAPALFGGDPVTDLADAIGIRFDSVEPVGPDLLLTAYPK